ncbi:MAG: aspartate aminotransferase family protein [Anaerolineae bacterium]|nr:aspartate aminotransferase family protein [Anaerolineae bacterium]MDK1080327.1 aspartate aminotransferase family protein [Anaerolineae bacterium]MDK1118099.1 aspartate aminotransferase family protein [Anaerolineae bacterium]
MKPSNIIEIESKHTSGLYKKQPFVIVRGEAALLFDMEGNSYLDCTSGHGVANLGHAHPKIAEALAKQSTKLITLFETFPNDQRAMLMSKITSLVPDLERVFFCNSGTEAVEAALKFSRLSTGRSGIIASMRGFHGRTMGALSATWNKHYREAFEPLVPEYSHVPFNNIDRLDGAVTDQTAAVLLEVVQGEGGIYLANPEYLEAARRFCTERGTLLIFDEIQTGFCRTGKMFAFQHYDITPDMICVAKSLAGGVPIGAVLIGPSVQGFSVGLHGSTFGGNPLACAAANAALQVMEDEDLARQAEEKGEYLMDKLNELNTPIIREIRGLGLMIGIELKQKVAPFMKALQDRRILALNAGLSIIRLLPPLVITYEQIDMLVDALSDVLVPGQHENAG